MRPARAANPYEYGAIYVCIFLACVPHARPQNSARPSLQSQRLVRRSSKSEGGSNPSRRVLPLIERNILMILFRHRVPVTRGHRATVDRTVDLLLPGHLGRFLFLRRRLLLFRSRAAVFSAALASGAAVDVAAGAVPPLGAPCASATPAGRNTRATADAATTRRGSFCMGSSGSGQLRFRPDPITSAAVRTPGFWRRGRPWPGCACPGCRS